MAIWTATLLLIAVKARAATAAAPPLIGALT